MPLDLTEVSGFTRQFYMPEITSQLNESSPLYFRLSNKKAQISGQDLIANIPLKYQHNEGVGYRAENVALPAPLNTRHRFSQLGQAYLYARARITGQAQIALRAGHLGDSRRPSGTFGNR